MRILIAARTGLPALALLLSVAGCQPAPPVNLGASAPPPSPAKPESAGQAVTPAGDLPDAPLWLYPKVERTPVKETQWQVPGSSRTYSDAQMHDLFNTIDWRPDDHPPMPPVVASGRKPDVQACGYCHLATGLGRPESAPVAGLPVAYFVGQLQAFASGKRHTSSSGAVRRADGTMGGGRLAMNSMAAEMTPDEMRAAAEYFAGRTFTPWIKVVEADTAPPLTYVTGFPVAHPDQTPEPIAGRIVEYGDDQDRALLRDPAIGFTALVPRGAIARGKALAQAGGATCDKCHGAGLKGGQGAIAPPIAGRSPTYIARALFDFAHGSRDDPAAQVMKPSAAKLSLDEMVAVAAYVASLPP